MATSNVLRGALASGLGLMSVLIAASVQAVETAPVAAPVFSGADLQGLRCLKMYIPGVPCPGPGSSQPRPRPTGLEMAQFASQFLSGRLNSLLPLKEGEQRFLMDPRWEQGKRVAPGVIEVRVAQTVLADCNGMAFSGSFKPLNSVQSERYQFWRFKSGGLMTTLIACPESTRHERLVWMSGKPGRIPWSGRATVIDLPEGWTLQWRRIGGAWINARPLPARLSSSGAPSEQPLPGSL